MLAFAGGATPEFNQVSLEQDLGLVRETFGPGGYVLFGAGAGSPSVQVLVEHDADPVVSKLADLFAPMPETILARPLTITPRGRRLGWTTSWATADDAALLAHALRAGEAGPGPEAHSSEREPRWNDR